MNDNMLNSVSEYYSRKIVEHGISPQGVDWRDVTSQEARFFQLAKLIESEPHCSICDLGCGYAAFANYLRDTGWQGQYEGVDISEEMVNCAKKSLQKDSNAILTVGSKPFQKADFVVASGIFNVRLQADSLEWSKYIFRTIDLMVEYAKMGVAFNCLSSWSDKDRMRADLHYCNPAEIIEYCGKKHSRWLEISHDYDLFEFTVRMRFNRSHPSISVNL